MYLQGLIFAVTDALFLTNISATCFSLSLQILLGSPIMYNCIYILPFLGFEDTSFTDFTSTSHIFDNMRVLLIEIMHPQLTLSMPCGYSQSKFCIFNTLKFTIADIFPHILWVAIYFTTWANTLPTKNWYKKFERIWSERWWHLERKFLC